MRSRTLWLGGALAVTLVLGGLALAGPGEGGKGGKGDCAAQGQVGFGKAGFARLFDDKENPGKGKGFGGKADDKGGRGKGGPGGFGPGGFGGFGGRGKGGPGGFGGFGGRGADTDITADRLLTFDKNKDGKV